MPGLSHSEIIHMMEPVGTVWVQSHARGLDIDISIQSDDDRPAVYAWVAADEIIYIGKSGKGLRRRMAQHRGGFRNSARGKGHAEHLAALTDAGTVVMLYAMWPPPIEFQGHSVPSHSAVEEWLIGAADPIPKRNLAIGRLSR